MTGSNVSGAPTLLQEFLDQAQRDTETMGNLVPRPFVGIRVQAATGIWVAMMVMVLMSAISCRRRACFFCMA
jgi:hypothetical protein